jgi:glycosyltransferase involved in cell wall biosynthesis
MDYTIIWLREQIGWMGKHSGYDLLCNYASQQLNSSPQSVWIERKGQLPCGSRTVLSNLVKRGKTCLPYYNERLAIAELKTFWTGFRHPDSLLHIMYVERDFGLLQQWGKRFFKSLIGTVHQPAGLWRIGRHDPRVLSKLNAIITPSSNELSYFEQYLPNRVFFVPHGVDIYFFCPDRDFLSENEARSKPPRCVFCGIWLRDLPTLAQTIDEVLDRNQSIQFDLVIPKQARNNQDLYRIARHSQVHWHSDLSDEQLRSLYRQANMLFLPLMDSTANNALLEAISCGLPVVSNRVGGVPDYTRDTFAELLPVGDIDGLTQAILRLADDPQEQSKRGQAARSFAQENLSWTQIAAQTLEVYSKVFQ